jgi:hypothetical protein
MSILEADLSGKLTHARTAVASRIKYIDSQLFTVMIPSALSGLLRIRIWKGALPGGRLHRVRLGLTAGGN